MKPTEHRTPDHRGLASVTVIADDATSVHAPATALIVMGPERGLARAERDGIAALFILRDEGCTLADAPMTA